MFWRKLIFCLVLTNVITEWSRFHYFFLPGGLYERF
jgi:hypothetical protein